MMREVAEEYGVEVQSYEQIGVVTDIEDGGIVNFRHVFLVTSWIGELSNPENKNKHLEAGLDKARKICKHPVSQRILNLLEEAVKEG